MNNRQERKIAMLERIDAFLTKYPLTPAIPRATTLAGELKGALTAMRTQGGDQQNGFGGFRLGASQRQGTGRNLYGELRDISDALTSLDPEEFPGVAEQFRLPKVRSFQRLLDTARAFLTALAPVKALLVQRGFPADFDEMLQGFVTDFDAATDRKNEGRQKQRTNTAALALTAEQVRTKSRELDAIVSKALKLTNPALLAAWKSSVRVYSARQAQGDATPPASTPAPAPDPTPTPSA